MSRLSTDGDLASLFMFKVSLVRQDKTYGVSFGGSWRYGGWRTEKRRQYFGSGLPGLDLLSWWA